MSYEMRKAAHLSPCRAYRYSLWRQWADNSKPLPVSYAMFIGLNPSTADEKEDDPTIRRCIAFAKAWGYDGLCMTNLFAFRATQPHDMMAASDPVGDYNDTSLGIWSQGAGIVVAAWGTHGSFQGRDKIVRKMLPDLHYLRLTKDGHPGHPLYLPKTLMPLPWGDEL